MTPVGRPRLPPPPPPLSQPSITRPATSPRRRGGGETLARLQFEGAALVDARVILRTDVGLFQSEGNNRGLIERSLKL